MTTTTRNTYGIELKTTLVATGKRDADDWEHDVWHVTLKRGDHEMTLPEYRMGIGHRRTKNGCTLQRRGNYQVLVTDKGKVCHHSLCQSTYPNSVKPVPPDLYDVLCSLKADLTHGETFEDWALNLGYDPDSRKALNIYLACQEEERQFRRLMGDMFDTLVADEDYE